MQKNKVTLRRNAAFLIFIISKQYIIQKLNSSEPPAEKHHFGVNRAEIAIFAIFWALSAIFQPNRRVAAN
ncbi:hypothetical protein N6L24_12170 [Cognatishimia sp. SS12]|nr:hypothetical protein [Cognatishimia sp. SS12]